MTEPQRTPYTLDELRVLAPTLQPLIEQKMREMERQYHVRPLPALTVDEAVEFILNFVNHATQRLLTPDESFLVGQLINQLTQAVRAEMLTNRPGRYYVISDEDIAKVQRSL